MNGWNLEKNLACPRCKKHLTPKGSKGRCTKCKFPYLKKEGIWHLLYTSKRKTKASLKVYDKTHEELSGIPNDGLYKILAAIARGNKTVDIACGQGFIERLTSETVGVEFSLTALKKAKRAGAKYLVLADAHNLPFIDDTFDIAISAGSLEHFANPQKAILEMARVSKMQVLTVHREFDFPFAPTARSVATYLLKVKDQPIETPFRWKQLEKMLKKAKLHIVFKGFWTLPINYGKVFTLLPVFKKIPSSFFVITIKKNQLAHSD
jgi:ubiquinone/menaquinone biosynthesis C-methylase UbiE